jgi:predicted nucleotidyltransferase
MVDTLETSGPANASVPAGAKAVVARLEAHRDELLALGVTSLTLFGSRVRGDERKDSDLDILIDYDRTRRFTLYDVVDLKRYLSEVVGIEAHIVTREGFAPDRLRRLLKHSVDVF